MFLYKITLTPKNSKFKMSEDIEDTIYDYLGCLYKNGQIMLNYELIKEEKVYCAYCKFIEKNSLNNKYNNKYVNERLNKLEEIFDLKIEELGEEINNEVCSCKLPSWYMLHASYLEGETPVICGDCGKSVPLYRLPKIMGQEEYFQELNWQRDYQNVDNLYVSCLSDRFTYRQMSNPNSQLSKKGRKICHEFEKSTNKPFYYYLANLKKNLNRCPICGEEWQNSNNSKTVDFKCEKCRLVTDKE